MGFFQAGILRRLKAPLSALDSRESDLASVAECLEKDFLRIGNSLESMTEHSHRLVSQCESLLELVLGRQGGEVVLQDAVKLLRGPVDFVGDCYQRSEELVRLLREQQSQMVSALNFQSTLQETLAPLRFVQVAFKIESATLSEENKRIFRSLIEDIERLNNRIGQSFREQAAVIRKSNRTIEEMVVLLEAQIRHGARFAVEKKSILTSTLQGLQADLEENMNRDVRLSGVMRQISQQVSGIVRALQYHDITRQKIQHVQSAVADLKTRYLALKARPGWSRDGGNLSALREIREIARLEAGQLEAVQADLAEADGIIRDSVAKLKDLIGQLDHEAVTLQSFRTISVAGDGMIQSLLTVLAETRALVVKSTAMLEHAYRTIKPVGGMATDLTNTIHHLSHNIKLIALNAQVQAAHVGRGTGLETLSERTASISTETLAVNEQAAVQLGGLVAGLDSVVAEFECLRDRGLREQNLLDSEAGRVERELHSYRDRTLAVFHDVDQLAQGLQVKMDQLVEGAGFEDKVSGSLRDYLGPLHEITGLLDAALPPIEKGAAAELTARFSQNYTMRSERMVHHASTGGSSDTDSGARDDVDVELFDLAEAKPPAGDATPAGDRPEPALPAASPPAGEVELF